MRRLVFILAIALVAIMGPAACVDPTAPRSGNGITTEPNSGGYTPNSNRGFGQPGYQNPGAGFPGSGFGSGFGWGD